MFSQEVVSKLSDASEEPAVILTSSGGDWDTAERFYQNGNFRYVASVRETPRIEQVANADRRDDSPAVFIAAIVQDEAVETPAAPDSSPAAPAVDDQQTARPVDPPSDPLPAPAEEIADVPADVPADLPADEPAEETPIFAAPAPADIPVDAEMDIAVDPVAEPQRDVGEIDVLPLPLKKPAREVAGFGVFNDEVVLPESDAAGPGELSSEQQFSRSGSYDIPEGHAMRYVDPMDLVRQRAIERAENRRRRIEARKWMGVDPLRPAVTAVPYTTAPQTYPALIVIPFVVRGDR